MKNPNMYKIIGSGLQNGFGSYLMELQAFCVFLFNQMNLKITIKRHYWGNHFWIEHTVVFIFILTYSCFVFLSLVLFVLFVLLPLLFLLLILLLLRLVPCSSEAGIDLLDVRAQLPHLSFALISSIADFLADQGYIYQTIDDKHFKSSTATEETENNGKEGTAADNQL